MKTPGIASKKSPDSSGLFFTFLYGGIAAIAPTHGCIAICRSSPFQKWLSLFSFIVAVVLSSLARPAHAGLKEQRFSPSLHSVSLCRLCMSLSHAKKEYPERLHRPQPSLNMAKPVDLKRALHRLRHCLNAWRLVRLLKIPRLLYGAVCIVPAGPTQAP